MIFRNKKQQLLSEKSFATLDQDVQEIISASVFLSSVTPFLDSVKFFEPDEINLGKPTDLNLQGGKFYDFFTIQQRSVAAAGVEESFKISKASKDNSGRQRVSPLRDVALTRRRRNGRLVKTASTRSCNTSPVRTTDANAVAKFNSVTALIPREISVAAKEADASNDEQQAQKASPLFYTLKRPKTKYSSVDASYQATLGLILESKYLSRLQHPNIVQLKGLPRPDEKQTSSFFVITERSVITLEEKLDQWRAATGEVKTAAESLDATSHVFRQKLQHAKDIAKALQYLHERNLVLINLNPQTVGFSNHGTLQLIDLSCCSEVPNAAAATTTVQEVPVEIEIQIQKEQGMTPDTAKSPKTATCSIMASMASGGFSVPRYVAPEVVLDGTNYSIKSDSYSWALVVYELLTLSKPYGIHRAGQHLTKVCIEGQRPQISLLPKEWRHILNQCWRHTAEKRRSMSGAIEALPTARRRAMKRLQSY